MFAEQVVADRTVTCRVYFVDVGPYAHVAWVVDFQLTVRTYYRYTKSRRSSDVTGLNVCRFQAYTIMYVYSNYYYSTTSRSSLVMIMVNTVWVGEIGQFVRFRVSVV